MTSFHGLLGDSTLFLLLLEIDRDLAKTDREKGCRHCRRRLDVANYERKPRGAPDGLPGEFSLRFSNCCSNCRKRSTPPSCRFLGAKVYLGVVVCLLTAMRQGPTPPTARRLKGLFGVSRRTLKRWQKWWREFFPTTRTWKELRARFMPPVAEGSALPLSLVSRFAVESIQGVSDLMRFLSPLSLDHAS